MTYNARPFFKLALAYLLVFGLLITLLVLSDEPVYAEWEKLGPDDEGSMTVYIDRDTIRRKGNLVKMWQLYDFKTAQTVAGVSFLSGKLQFEYDCREERNRRLAESFFSGNMGSGEVVHTDSDVDKWEPVVPETLGQFFNDIACGKR